MAEVFIPSIRAAVLIVREERLLLVHETDPRTRQDFWVPPGGGLEPSDASLPAAARREVLEETGLSVELGRLVYYREFRDEHRLKHWLELFFFASEITGDLRSLPHKAKRSHLAREAQWFSQDELRPLRVYPEVLKQDFWTDLQNQSREVRYLGLSQG